MIIGKECRMIIQRVDSITKIPGDSNRKRLGNWITDKTVGCVGEQGKRRRERKGSWRYLKRLPMKAA